jgi:hypothetical protein
MIRGRVLVADHHPVVRCPSISMIDLRSTPAMPSRDPAVCRKTWNLKSGGNFLPSHDLLTGQPASFTANQKALVRTVNFFPSRFEKR